MLLWFSYACFFILYNHAKLHFHETLLFEIGKQENKKRKKRNEAFNAHEHDID